VNFKPGDLIRIKRPFTFVRCVNIASADWFDFHADQVGLYLKWRASKHSGAVQLALILVGETKCYVDEADIELIPSTE
jgi:hypothetical protein